MNELLKNMELMASEENCEISPEGKELIECVSNLMDNAFMEGYKKGLAAARKGTAEYAKTGREEME